MLEYLLTHYNRTATFELLYKDSKEVYLNTSEKWSIKWIKWNQHQNDSTEFHLVYHTKFDQNQLSILCTVADRHTVGHETSIWFSKFI